MRRYFSVVLVVCAGAVLSLVGAAWQYHNQQRFIQDVLKQRAAQEAARLEKEIARAGEMLASIAGLFAASASVEREEFRAFTTGVLKVHPEFQALEWLPRIPDNERTAFESRLHETIPGRGITERNAQGDLVPAGRRAEYFPILFAEPLEHNAAILGFDAASRPEALDAMANARDSGRIASTGTIALIQGNMSKKAALLYVPIYRSDKAGESIAARHANLAGYVVGVMLYGELLENVPAGLVPTGLDWLLLDLDVPAADRLLYFHPSRTRGQGDTPVPDPADVRAGLHHERAVEFPGREWRLLFRPAPGFDAEFASYWHWIILLTGIALTGLLAAYIARRVRHGHELRALAEQVRESESRYRTLVASSPVVIYRCRADGDFGASYVSPNVIEQMKLSPEQFTENSSFWADRIHPEDRPRVFQELGTLFEHGSHEHEYRFMFGDGTYHWMHDRLTLRQDENGKPVDIVGAWLDVTERKRAEMALRRSEREWTDAMDSFGDIVYVLDTNRHLLRANRAFFDMVGGGPDALLGRHIAGIIHPQGEAEPCPVCRAQEGLRDAVITMESNHPDNPSGQPIEITVKILRNEAQEATGILMSLHDLTHERQARAQVVESEARFRSIIEASPVPMALNDEQLSITYLNPAFVATFGYTRADIPTLADWWPRAYPDLDYRQWVSAEWVRRLDRARAQGAAFEPMEIEIRAKDGTLRSVSASATSLGEAFAGTHVVILYDITARKRAELALRDGEERLRLALAAGNQGLYDLDLRTGEAIVNAEYARMLGYAPEEFHETNAAWRERLHPDDQEPAFKSFEEYVAGRMPEYRVEFRQRTKSGEWKWILSVGKIVEWNESGRPLRMLGTHTDISARRTAEEDIRRQTRLMDSIVENIPNMIFLKRADDLRFALFNKAGEQLLGLKREDLLGKNDYDLFPGEQADFFAAKDRAVLASSDVLDIPEEPIDTAHGRRLLHTRKLALRDAQGAPEYLLGISEDISVRKQAEEDLRIAAVTFQSHEGIMITDADTNIIRVNRAFEEITGFRAEEVIGHNPRILQSGRHDGAFYQTMWATLRETGEWSGEIWDRRKNGEIYPKFMTITAVRNENGRLSNYVAAFTDISLRKQTEEEIHQLAFFDPLTSLPNRRLFLDRLQQTMAASHRSGRHGALLMLDLDHFKTINDTLGHALGDLLLREVADRLNAAVREGDTVARLGGDEFVVVLEGLSNLPEEAASQAEHVAEKIRTALAQPYRLRDYEHHSTSSIGVSLFLGHVENESELLKHADVALYQAKAAGRNAIRFYDPQMQAALDKRAALEADLRHALRKQEFLLHYQVQVDSEARPFGAEVLVRWQHPERGFVGPDQFIPLAEESGLIVPIGDWVLETACAQLVAWEGDPLTRDLTLAVNVSARQFRQADFAAKVQDILQVSAVNPARLKLELTESAVLEDIEDAIERMRALQQLGVAFSLDDFGTGHSSLSYLKRLPLAQIKIDRSFVRDIATDPNDAAIVDTIIAMSRTMGLNVIAEGVETEAQRDFLDSHGCHAFQGYLFGRPVPLDQFEADTRVSSRH